MNSVGTRRRSCVLDLADIAARRESGAVRHAEDVRVDGHGRLPERRVEHDVRGLATDAGQRFERLARLRHLAGVELDELPAGRDDVAAPSSGRARSSG